MEKWLYELKHFLKESQFPVCPPLLAFCNIRVWVLGEANKFKTFKSSLGFKLEVGYC